ncbi:F-box domain-containing protein [Madurella fahalii]|uniref:F-box domain-containing protein n=1 Tax=Madurella fahalii TaxID=1157608 RepID=A0ABQ0G4H9_9PEZI
MGTGFLARTGPPELILHIFQCCDSAHDLLSLALTSHHIYGIWQAHAPAVVWRLWLAQIPCFEDALTAARLTRLVADAEHRGELSPVDLTPNALSGSPLVPTVSELKAALALSDLAAAQEVVFYVQHTALPADWAPPEIGMVLPEEPSRMLEWSRHVHKAIYRVFIAGAALAGAYTEPLFKASPELGLELVRDRDPLSRAQLNFLEQYAVCNMAASPEAEEAVFGAFGAWLFESILSDKNGREAMAYRFRSGYGRARRCQNLKRCPLRLVDGGSHSDAHFVVWEVMKMVWAFDHAVDAKHAITRAAAAPDPWSPASPASSVSPASSAFPARYESQAEEGCDNAFRTALVALFGVFRAEESTPIDQNVSTRRSATTFFDWIYTRSGRPNCIRATGDLVAPLTFKFFEYFLRRCLGLRFLPNAFHNATFDGEIFNGFATHSNIFGLDDDEDGEACYAGPDITVQDLSRADFLDGSEILTSFHPAPELAFYSRYF